MSNIWLTKISLFALLLVSVGVWIIILILMWLLTTLYLEALTRIVEIAQLS